HRTSRPRRGPKGLGFDGRAGSPQQPRLLLRSRGQSQGTQDHGGHSPVSGAGHAPRGARRGAGSGDPPGIDAGPRLLKARPMPQTQIGRYEVRSGKRAIPFWRIVPGTDARTLGFNTLFWPTKWAHVAPNDSTTWNTVTLPPGFGIFDIVVRMSEPIVENEL